MGLRPCDASSRCTALKPMIIQPRGPGDATVINSACIWPVWYCIFRFSLVFPGWSFRGSAGRAGCSFGLLLRHPANLAPSFNGGRPEAWRPISARLRVLFQLLLSLTPMHDFAVASARISRLVFPIAIYKPPVHPQQAFLHDVFTTLR